MGKLILARYKHEGIEVCGVRVTVVETRKNRVKLLIEADDSIPIKRITLRKPERITDELLEGPQIQGSETSEGPSGAVISKGASL